jgi:hypothetical protein
MLDLVLFGVALFVNICYFVMLKFLSGFVSVCLCVVQTGKTRLPELNAARGRNSTCVGVFCE